MYLIKLEVRHYLLAYWDGLEDNIDFCAADRLPQIYYALNRLILPTLRPANIPQIFLIWSSSGAKYMVCVSAFTPSTCGD